MLAEAQSELILGHWWQLAAATLFMAVFVTAFSLMTDALRDALDPKLRGLGMSADAALLSIQRPARSSFRLGTRRRGAACEARRPRRQGVSFDVPENTTVALVGESGSGKSVTAMSIAQPAARQRRAQRRASSSRAATCSPRRAASCRRCAARDIACVFQDPMSSLNPVFTVGEQIAEPLRQAPRPRARAQALRARRGAARRGRHARAEARAWTPIRTSSPAASSSA